MSTENTQENSAGSQFRKVSLATQTAGQKDPQRHHPCVGNSSAAGDVGAVHGPDRRRAAVVLPKNIGLAVTVEIGRRRDIQASPTSGSAAPPVRYTKRTTNQSAQLLSRSGESRAPVTHRPRHGRSRRYQPCRPRSHPPARGCKGYRCSNRRRLARRRRVQKRVVQIRHGPRTWR